MSKPMNQTHSQITDLFNNIYYWLFKKYKFCSNCGRHYDEFKRPLVDIGSRPSKCDNCKDDSLL